MKVYRSTAVAFFTEMGFESAHKWYKERLVEKLRQLDALDEDEREGITSPAGRKLLADALKAISDEDEIEIVTDSAPGARALIDKDDELENEEEEGDEDGQDLDDDPPAAPAKPRPKAKSKAASQFEFKDDDLDDDDDKPTAPLVKPEAAATAVVPPRESIVGMPELIAVLTRLCVLFENAVNQSERVAVSRAAGTKNKSSLKAVVSEIANIMRAANKESNAVTMEHVLKKLVEKFPDRDRDWLIAKLSVQLGGRMSRASGLKISQSGKKFWTS